MCEPLKASADKHASLRELASGSCRAWYGEVDLPMKQV